VQYPKWGICLIPGLLFLRHRAPRKIHDADVAGDKEMDPAVVVVLFTATAINAALPGPCTILTATRSAVAGQGAGVRITLGVLSANLVLVTITLVVMHGALTISDQAFGAMKWGGIAVLFAMAARMLLSKSADRVSATCASHSLSEIGAGLMVGLSSPYNLVFLLALLPQFVPAEISIVTAMAVIAAVLSGAAAAQLGAVTLGVCSRGVLGGGARWLDRTGAVCLIGFAVTALAV
jgi:threonine/homoserine/homoserine lactone efflux protein